MQNLYKRYGKAKVLKTATALGTVSAVKFIEKLDRQLSPGDKRTPGERQKLMRKYGVKKYGQVQNQLQKLRFKLYNQSRKKKKK